MIRPRLISAVFAIFYFFAFFGINAPGKAAKLSQNGKFPA
jgi:hypothetical protein